MKSMLAIFAIALLLATALSGCVGSEKGTDGTDNGTGGNGSNGGTGNETGNQTGGNASGNQTAPAKPNYHAEYNDSVRIYDTDLGIKNYAFPVNADAKKIKIFYEQSNVMLPAGSSGAVTIITDAEGTEKGSISNGETFELKNPKSIGDWNAEVVLQIDSVSCDFHLVIDVLYS
ncbi:MAG: hypothetical protein PHH26_06120 [Candidatus Thermoplasmatota archaeon]|nr:hypothetical protein [Candidatus Thermoplasmatota archaeon]